MLILGGRPPFYDKKFEYKEHENYRLTSDANSQYSYEYIPLPPPKELLEDSHGENIIIPTEESIVEVEKIEFDPNEDETKLIEELSEKVKGKNLEFINAIGGCSTEEYLAVAEELEEQRFDTIDELLKANQAIIEVEQEVEKIEILDIVDTIRGLGRTFRNYDFVPTGFVGVDSEVSITELSEEKQDEIIKEVESFLFEDDEEQEVYEDDSLTDEFADGVNELLDIIGSDDDLLDSIDNLKNL